MDQNLATASSARPQARGFQKSVMPRRSDCATGCTHAQAATFYVNGTVMCPQRGREPVLVPGHDKCQRHSEV